MKKGNIAWDGLNGKQQVQLARSLLDALKNGPVEGEGISIHPDSVGGNPCIVIYKDKKPFATVWNNDDLIDIVSTADPTLAENMANLAKTMEGFGCTWEQLNVALHVYLSSRKGD
jgi:hypothetical protein